MKNNKRVSILFFLLLILVGISCNALQPATESIPVQPPQTPTKKSLTPTIKPSIITPSVIPTDSDNLKFDLSTSNQTTPKDILEEIAYYPQGGGGGDFMCDGDVGSAPSITPQNIEWMAPFKFLICWWGNEETVSITVVFPDKSTVTDKIVISALTTGQGIPSAIYEIPRTPDMQVGQYQVMVDGISGHLETKIDVTMPSDPRLYSIGERFLVLYNFAPHEKVKLLAYSGKLVGWQQYQVDETGKLFINISDGSLEYYAVGEYSGQVANRLSKKAIWGSDASIRECGGLKTRVEPGDRVVVTYSDGVSYFIYDWPFRLELVDVLGGQMTVLSGYQCMHGNWWLVRHDNGTTGWIQEDKDGQYLLEPIINGDFVVQDCGGLKSRLSPGDKAVIPEEVGVNYLREWPYQGQPLLVFSATVTILGEQQCVQNTTWWYVRIDDGTEGWMLEESGGRYLLEPLP